VNTVRGYAGTVKGSFCPELMLKFASKPIGTLTLSFRVFTVAAR
jgi:hypothetical protein